MAKKEGVSFADLVAGLEKNNLKLNASIQAQLDSQLKTEKVLSDTKALEASQTSDSIRATKADDALFKDIHKGLIEKRGDGLNAQVIKLAATMKEMNSKIPKSTGKLSKEQTEGLTGLAGGVKTFKGIRERISDFGKGVKDKYGPGNIGNTMLKAVNVGGIFDKRIEQNEFIKQQRALGVHGNTKDSTLRDKFNKRNEVAKDIQKNEAELERLKKDTGLNESALGKTKVGAGLIANREKLAGKFGKYDVRSKLLESSDVSSGMDDGRIKAGPKAPAADAEEVANEQAKVQTEQFAILQKIEENTRPEGAAGKGGSDSGGGGILAGIGKGLGALGGGLGKLGGGIGKGIKGILVGLAEGIVALGTAVATGVGALGLAALAGIILTIAAALRIAAPAIKEFAPVLMKLAEQIGIVAGVIGGIFIEGIKAIPKILGAVGDIIGQIGESIVNIIVAVTDSIERLSKIDGTNLISVGAGLLAVSAGLASFGAANAIAGVGNLVGGFLSGVSGQKTPIEQLEQIAGFGPNLNQAGTGVKNLAKGLTEFSSIDTEKIAAISKLPVEKIAAMGALMSNANAVYDKSGKNKEAAVGDKSAPQSAPVVVSAPTTINKTNQQGFFNTPIRNQDNTLNSYLKSRYVS